MTWLFIRFYVGVLIVLFLAWFIYGIVLKQRAEAETARVIVQAHTGGARLVARELDDVPRDKRGPVLKGLRASFDYPLDVVPVIELPDGVQRTLSSSHDVAYLRLDNKHYVVARLSNRDEVVQLGAFPVYSLQAVEESIGGWMRVTADQLEAIEPEERQAALQELREQFVISVDLVGRVDLPAWPQERIASGDDVVFYTQDPGPNARFFAVTPLSDEETLIRFGPFPSFERSEEKEEKAATTTLALVLLPAALAIAMLLRPVARQLRHVEHAARAIAAGELNARVDERRVRSAKPLAHAFNHMASRVERLLRTQRELLQAVSHELRTPLSRMRFAIDLIDTAKDDKQRKKRLESLDAATEELDQLVGELLSYVRLETTDLSLNVEPISLRDSLEVLVQQHAALNASIRFELGDNTDDQQAVIVAERTGFQRAITNLLSNAGRFAKSHVSVEAEVGDRFITIDIDDDGEGIPESDRERVFEPFVRLDSHANGRGAGLGLALVRRIVSKHGGSVDVMTSPCGGCRVRTKWPAGEAAADPE